MAENKKSVLLYCDIIHTVKELSDEEAGKLFKHYLEYINDLNPSAPDKLTQIVFEPIKQNLKRDLKKWEDKSLKNKEIANIRWQKNNANACERINSDANDADKDKVTVKVTDKDKGKDIINIWFKDLENSSQLETICINNKFDINQVRNIKIPEFRKVSELEYPNYQKFVSHFKNWIVKNPPKDLNAPLKMVY